MTLAASREAPPTAATLTGKPFAARLDGPAKNMARIHDGLDRGAQPDDGDLKALRDLGIKTIVNLRSNHSERKEAEGEARECRCTSPSSRRLTCGAIGYCVPVMGIP
jgi:hypothetical protein